MKTPRTALQLVLQVACPREGCVGSLVLVVEPEERGVVPEPGVAIVFVAVAVDAAVDADVWEAVMLAEVWVEVW